MEGFRLSATSLGLLRDCPRCFWLDRLKHITRPEGPKSSLPNGMDRVLKAHFDSFRGRAELPPELKGADFDGVRLFQDQSALERMRNWKTGLRVTGKDGSTLIGALDDLLEKDGKFIPFDFKTKGKTATREDALKYNLTQLDCYTLLLESNRMPTPGHGFLLFYSPQSVTRDNQICFEVQVMKLETDPVRAREVLNEAVKVLKGTIPEAASGCKFCAFREIKL